MTIPDPGKLAMGMGISVGIPAGEWVDQQVFRTTSHKLHSTSTIYGSTIIILLLSTAHDISFALLRLLPSQMTFVT
jgi:hypothetical protein